MGSSPLAATQPASAPCATCIVASVAPGQALALPARIGGLEILVRVAAGESQEAVQALKDIQRRGSAAGLHLIGLPETTLDRAAIELVSRVIVDVSAMRDTDADALAFQLKKALTAVRAASARPISVGMAVRGGQGRALLARDLAAYVDVIVWTGEPAAETTIEEWGVLAEPVDDAAALLRTAGAGASRVSRLLWRAPEDVVSVARILADVAAAAPLLPPGLVPSAGAELSCGGRPLDTFLNPETLDTVALAERCDPQELHARSTAATPERVLLSSGVAIVRLPAAQDRVAEGVQVTAARQLSVDEIIARHQAAAARQAAAVRQLISSGTMTLTFEAPGFPAPVAITSDVVIYAGRDRTEIEQRAVRVNGIEFRGGGIPRLPIIEPERVASPPLEIALTNVYRYALAGRDTVADTLCYVVSFTPVNPDRPLFRGRAWIAADSFAMVKVAAAQTALRGPIVSSEQVDAFRPDEGGRWLLARSEVRQIYEGAAHRTPIHRVLEIDTHEVNPPAFVARRAAAYASSSIMLRDTPEGYRYLRRQPGSAGAPGDAAAAREPEVAGGESRVRTLIAGAIVDPNITRPLPFAGLSYVDFDLLGTGAQLNAFFGGTYGQMAFSMPSLAGTRWQLAGRAFGIASSYNDRAFVDGREQYAHNIRQRPAHASVWLLRPITPRVSIRAGYDLDYTHFAPSDTTAPEFVVPAHQVNHGARLALEGQRGGWNASLWWNPTRRSGWRAWGRAGSRAFDPEHRDFQRYGATVARSAVLSPQLVGRVEAAWMSGRDLDRFSRYAFGAFDNRLRGYPSALVRYDRGAVLRTAIAWAPGGLIRLDGFADAAYVRDPGFGASPRSYTGFGAAVEAPAPFGTLVAVEWGYGVQGINADGRRGTHVIRLSAFKIF